MASADAPWLLGASGQVGYFLQQRMWRRARALRTNSAALGDGSDEALAPVRPVAQQ
jgi:hypothetical protein